MESTNSESINYQKRVFNHPSYRSSRQLPNNGSMAPILLANSQTSVSFDLPAQCFNLSRSKLVFSLVCTPTTRGVTINACPTSLWDRVVLSTRGGLTLLDLPSAQFYGKMVSPASTSMEEYSGRSSGCSMNANAATVTAYTTAASSQMDPISGLAPSRTLTNGNFKVNSGASQFALTEQRYAIRGVDVVAQGNVLTPVSTSYAIPLSTLAKHTLLDIDKDLYFGEILTLTLVFAPYSSWVFEQDANFANVAALGVAPVVSNFQFLLSLESNPVIVNALREKVASSDGFTMMTGYPLLQKTQTGAAGMINSVMRVNRGQGSNILRTYTSFFTGNNALTAGLDNSNVAGAVLSSYYTTTDGYRDSDFDYRYADSTDWLANRDLLVGSVVQARRMWDSSYVHITDWSGQSPCRADDTIITGLSMDHQTERQLAFTATVGAAGTLYVFTIMQKTLVLSGGQIMLV